MRAALLALALIACATGAHARVLVVKSDTTQAIPLLDELGVPYDVVVHAGFVVRTDSSAWRDSTPEQQAAARWRASYRIVEPPPWWDSPWVRTPPIFLLVIVALALLYRHGRIEDAEWPEDCDGGEPIR